MASDPVGVHTLIRPLVLGVSMHVSIRTSIRASAPACFDLARDIDLHLRTLAGTGERAVAGVTTGLIGANEEVTWEARHFGVRHRMTVRIVEFDPPHLFRDRMLRGPFRRFDHLHRFEQREEGTIMIDEIDFASPYGPIGWVVDRLVLAPHLRRLLHARADAIRIEVERVD